VINFVKSNLLGNLSAALGFRELTSCLLVHTACQEAPINNKNLPCDE
jgi:hypothetical protein